MTLLEWISDIIIAELFDPDCYANVAVFEAKDAKLSYLPQLHVFNILIYTTDKDSCREVVLPLSMALEETIGCKDVAEAKKNLKFMKSDCATIAQEMQCRINNALYLHSRTWKIFDC